MAYYEIFDCRTGELMEVVLCTAEGALLRATVWGPQFDYELVEALAKATE